MKSKVFACDMRTSFRENIYAKLIRLITDAGFENVIAKRDLVAVKLNFGEKGNTGFVRPIYVRQVVDKIRALDARPFITDANTLYGGSRTDSASHLITAMENGFAYTVAGAPLIIADGLKGASMEEIAMDLPFVKTAYIAKDIFQADALISVAHFKGHELAGFGGTLKNLGMGAAARRGKLFLHSGISPKVKSKHCDACGDCIKVCGQEAIALVDIEGREKARINPDICIGCSECLLVCPNQAIRVQWDRDVSEFMKKMVEYTAAVLKNKKGKSFFINFLTGISPSCDCFPHSDAPLVPDLGIVASTDPIAIDQASVDLVNEAKGFEHTCPDGHHEAGADKFRGLYPQVDWSIQLDWGEQIGLGSRDYELVWLKNK